jgi:hypothetical protein
MEMRRLAALGIEKGKPFNLDAHMRDLLDKGAKSAYRMGHAIYFPARLAAFPRSGAAARPRQSRRSAISPR